MIKRDPLGRGLSAILTDIEEKTGTVLIPLEKIIPGKFQPRFTIRNEHLLELAASIKEKGLLQPIIVRKKNDRYEIIAGERRFRATGMAGLKEITAVVKDVDDRQALELALIENLQREDLNLVEIAAVYEKFIKDFGYTQQELAARVGLDRSSIANTVRILKLPEWIKQMIMDGKLTQGHARALLSLENEHEQKRFVERVLQEKISVRELERQVKQKKSTRSSPFFHVEEDLRERLNTKVNITYKKNKGKIIIEFYSKEDLERVLECIR